MIGEIVEHYRIERELGSGGMGVVYKAEDVRLGRLVALKFISSAITNDQASLERFRREARTMSTLNHPHACTVYDIGEHAGRPYIAMELLEGEPLSKLIGRGTLPAAEAVEVIRQVASALEAAHSRQIIHRDIKPANIFVSRQRDGSPYAKILDFGLARHADAVAAGNTRTVTIDAVTSAGATVGTVAYMSPEQARNQALDGRSDLFSLGAVLYEITTGHRAIDGGSQAVIFDQILNRNPEPGGKVRPDLPPGLGAVIERLLEKDRELRYQTASDLQADLRRLGRDTSAATTAAQPAQIRAGRKRGRIYAAAIPLVLAAMYWLRPEVPAPKITSSRQLTNSGTLKRRVLATDGARVYFSENTGERFSVSQVALTGGETAPIPTSLPNALVQSYSPGTSELLVAGSRASEYETSFYRMKVPGGTPVLVGGVQAYDAVLSADGHEIAWCVGGAIHLANADGTDSHRIASVEGRVDALGFSPDKSRLRFTVIRTNSTTIWEANRDGTGLHRVFPHLEANHSRGAWTPDGAWFVFQVSNRSSSDLYASCERSPLLRRRPAQPIPLTTGPLLYGAPLPLPDGSGTLSYGQQLRGELARYDAGARQFTPVLGGLSADAVAWSPDRKWIAYTTYPGSVLWRMKSNGSERLQLSGDGVIAELPKSSPDGSRIVYGERSRARRGRIMIVSRDGGQPTPVLAEDRSQMDPDFSADGRSIVFGRIPADETDGSPLALYIVDLSTRQVTTIPGSENAVYPHWSPDNRYLVAGTRDILGLRLYDFKTQQWKQLSSGVSFYPTWAADSRSVTMDTVVNGEPVIARVEIPTGKVTPVVSLKGIRQAGNVGRWSGTTPEGEPLILRQIGSQEIYALGWDLPSVSALW